MMTKLKETGGCLGVYEFACGVLVLYVNYEVNLIIIQKCFRE